MYKIICLMPVKNEVDLLPLSLGVISEYSDFIIIADQMSTDGSRDIYKRFPKVRVIDNKRDGHSNEVRWDLLKEARKIDGEKIIINLDADEYIPPLIFKDFINSNSFRKGESFRFPWIQMWKRVGFYNNSGAWYRNYQRILWVDDGISEYDKQVVINDHVSRVPPFFLKKCKRVKDVPVIHLQWLSWNKTQLKQAYYRCSELIKFPKEYKKINYSYSLSLDSSSKLKRMPKEWLVDIEYLNKIEKMEPSWHLSAILKFFDDYGIEFFEPLQIWHIQELKEEFLSRVGRNPKEIVENKFISKFKDFKRYIKKIIKY